MKKVWVLLALALGACQTSLPPRAPQQKMGDLQLPAARATRIWPTLPSLKPPDGLRPCCAFGYNIRAKLLGIPVPFVRLGNVVSPDKTGKHHYNDSWISIITTLTGMNSEHDGIVYTHRGGFIDLAHVRDTADNTLWLFNRILPQLGHATTITFSDELGQRIIRLWPYDPPERALDRYNLAIRLSARLAFQLAVWHEVAQWYGFESVPGYREGVSAFSPEDLYSNLLGARIAIDLLSGGGGTSLKRYNKSMAQMIPQALAQLQAVRPAETRFHFDMLDGQWWNSRCRLPDKFLVLQRNYNTLDRRLPSRPADNVPELWMTLPGHFNHQPLSRFARLEIWQGSNMVNLPPPRLLYGYADFATLARQAEQADRQYLAAHPRACH